jgi:hypothetical protein
MRAAQAWANTAASAVVLVYKRPVDERLFGRRDHPDLRHGIGRRRVASSTLEHDEWQTDFNDKPYVAAVAPAKNCLALGWFSRLAGRYGP